jgi:anti-sigma factor RsiW
MSHVDDGTLHAYLDAELSAVERDRVDAHLAACSACRERCEEERALVTRARDLLALAAPPRSIRQPDGPYARRRGRWSQVQVPLAWAATLVLAFAIGWYTQGERLTERLAPATPPQDLAATAPPRPPEPARPSRQNERRLADRLEADSTQLVLGQAPAVLPDRPVQRMTLSPDRTGVVVEQELAPGTTIRLYERRAGAQEVARAAAPMAAVPVPQAVAKAARGDDASLAPAREGRANEADRLARYVGALRVEIAGPLDADSLERLLEQVR